MCGHIPYSLTADKYSSSFHFDTMAQMQTKKKKVSVETVVTNCLKQSKHVTTDFSTIIDWLVSVVEDNVTTSIKKQEALTGKMVCDLTNDMLIANAITFSSNESLSVCNDIIESLITHKILPKMKETKEKFPQNTECLAVFNDDQLYYPCTIKSVQVKNSKYLVEFVGYGNQQITYFEQLMASQEDNSNNNDENKNDGNDNTNINTKTNTNANSNSDDNKKKSGFSLLSSIQAQDKTIAAQQVTTQIIKENNYQSKNKKKFKNTPII